MYSKYYNVNSFQVLWSRIKDIKCSRLKIEQYNNLPEHCVHPNYFEYHLKAKKDHAYLNDRPFGAHLSKNPQKEGRFLTLRGYVCKREIDQRFEELKYNLKKRGLSFSNLQKEYVVYDSNINLDLNWK